MISKKRIVWIDIAKALGIFLVIMGHTGFPILIRCWIYSFHMPLFFFISGLWFKELEIRENIKKKFKSYLIPFYGYSLIFLAINYILFRDKLQLQNSLLDIAVGKGSYPILWFLFALFFVENIYLIVYKIAKKSVGKVFFASLVLAMIGCIANSLDIPNYFYWQSIFEAVLFYSIGVIVKKPAEIEKHFRASYAILAGVICILITFLNYKLTNRYLDLSDGYMCIPPFGIIGALCGIFFIMYIAFMLQRFKFSKILIYIGGHTIIYYPLTGYIPTTMENFMLIFGVKLSSKIFDIILKLIGFGIATIVVHFETIIKSVKDR